MNRIGTERSLWPTAHSVDQLLFGTATSATLPIPDEESMRFSRVGQVLTDLSRRHTDPDSQYEFSEGMYVYVAIRHCQETDASEISVSSRMSAISFLERQTASPAIRIARNTLENTRAMFRQFCRQWKDATMFASSLTEIAMNAAYQRIIGMGRDALPLIIEELENENDHWFWALEAITGENPAHEVSGNLELMRTAWLDWARENVGVAQ